MTIQSMIRRTVYMAPADGSSGSLDAVAASMLETATGPEIVEEKKAGKAPTAAPAAEASSDSVSADEDASASDDDAEFSADDLLEAASEQEEEEELHDDDATDDEDGILDSDLDADSKDATDEERGDEGQDDDELTAEILGEKDNDRLVSVTVDGEEQTVTLTELKNRYAGEGAIERRIQEATEHRNATKATFDTGKQIIEAALKEFGQSLFARTTQPPNEALRQTNPTEFLLQRDAYDAETKAIQNKFARLGEVTKAADAERTKYETRMRNDAAIELQRIMPVLKDPKRGPIVRQRIVEAAKFIGYSDADIAACTDPKLFVAFGHVAKALAVSGKSSVKTAKPTARTLKPTGGANKPKPVAAQRQQSAALKRAQQTGSVDDVAMSMLEPVKRKR